jgi:DNA invertase Pin-like site-specific DNA recombinase
MDRIGEALHVGLATVSRDLEGFSTTEKPDRPKGGRPRSRKPAQPVTPEKRAEIVAAVFEQKEPDKEIAARLDLSESAVYRVVAVEREKNQQRDDHIDHEHVFTQVLVEKCVCGKCRPVTR